MSSSSFHLRALALCGVKCASALPFAVLCRLFDFRNHSSLLTCMMVSLEGWPFGLSATSAGA